MKTWKSESDINFCRRCHSEITISKKYQHADVFCRKCQSESNFSIFGNNSKSSYVDKSSERTSKDHSRSSIPKNLDESNFKSDDIIQNRDKFTLSDKKLPLKGDNHRFSYLPLNLDPDSRSAHGKVDHSYSNHSSPQDSYVVTEGFSDDDNNDIKYLEAAIDYSPSGFLSSLTRISLESLSEESTDKIYLSDDDSLPQAPSSIPGLNYAMPYLSDRLKNSIAQRLGQEGNTDARNDQNDIVDYQETQEQTHSEHGEDVESYQGRQLLVDQSTNIENMTEEETLTDLLTNLEKIDMINNLLLSDQDDWDISRAMETTADTNQNKDEENVSDGGEADDEFECDCQFCVGSSLGGDSCHNNEEDTEDRNSHGSAEQSELTAVENADYGLNFWNKADQAQLEITYVKDCMHILDCAMRCKANSSRLITKIRWVVESVNGRLKLWRYLANVVPNTQIPHIGDDIKLVAAICNKYKPPLNSGNQEEDQLLAAKMKMLASKGNALYERVVEEKLDRRIAAWKNMDSENVVEGFPTLSEEELTNITVGVYQLKLARSYTCEHLDEDGDYIIMLNDEIQDILRVKIQSRHTSSKLYLLWIEYGPAVIKGWYCQCKAGARVVGACAHVSSVLWYLGYARYADSVRNVKNWSIYLEDASNVPEEIEDSDSEASCPEEMSERDDDDSMFTINIEELSPLDLLMNDRRSELELMFENVIIQMLAVHPDLLGEQAPPPAAQSTIQNLPITPVTSLQISQNISCPICLCIYEECDSTTTLPCQHHFHPLCIKAWLSKSGTCPVCRFTLE